MRDYCSKWWRRFTDKSKKPGTRIRALVCLLAPFVVLILILVFVAYFIQNILPLVIGCLFLIYLFTGDYIDALFARKEADQQRRVWYANQQANEIWRRIAILIIPDIEQIVSVTLVPEEMIFNSATFPHGYGFYFSTPRLLSEQECKHLRHRIVLRLYGRLGKSREQMYREDFVAVEPNYIFVRNDPQIQLYFSSMI